MADQHIDMKTFSDTEAEPFVADLANMEVSPLDSDPIFQAYARYDADPRASGPDGWEAFRDAVLPLVTPE